MGALFGGSKTPSAPPLPPPLPAPPTTGSPEVQRAREEARARAALSGRQSTILTSSQGLTTQASTAKKTLLGS